MLKVETGKLIAMLLLIHKCTIEQGCHVVRLAIKHIIIFFTRILPFLQKDIPFGFPQSQIQRVGMIGKDIRRLRKAVAKSLPVHVFIFLSETVKTQSQQNKYGYRMFHVFFFSL